MLNLQFGLFGICDGHGGAEAAKTASKSVFNWFSLFCLFILNLETC